MSGRGANLFLVLLLMHYYIFLSEKKRNLSLLSSPFAVTTPIAFACILLSGGSGCFLPPTLLLLTISLTAEKKEWCRGGIPGGQISASLHRLKAEGGRNPNGVIGSGIRQTFGTISPNESWETTGSFIHFSENTNCVESHTNQGVVTPLSPWSRGELGGGCNRSSSLSPFFPLRK